MKFKEYTKQYEDVFTSEDVLTKCDITKIQNDKGMKLREYTDLFSSYVKDASDQLIEIAMKFHWLQRRFHYDGMQKKKTGWNNFTVDNAFSIYTKHYLMFNHRVITSSFYYTKLISYVDELFPDFDESNPFEWPEAYTFPFKHVTIDFLTVVYQMPTRLELLRIAEDKSMSYSEFLDYIVNYTSCYNEEYPGTFTFMYSRSCPPYVRYNKSPINKRRVSKIKL